ncbi:serine hydrolase domain-containing protein [Dehalobacterium formicoaceticum]|uniref:serine hydrolase domain-containing protein n=1 Tax=Dehalobacterium formicoaceticum TaxID=51515 RepID=UPI001FA90B93|nr:serine hydrolase domain-containing protein [Dehalobacterium formicoaceticum]
MKNPKRLGGRWIWVWFILLSLFIGLVLALFSGSLQIKRNIHADASLDDFRGYMDERIPALMKLYQIPGCSIALVRDHEIEWTESFGYADVEKGRILTTDVPMSVQSITKSVTAWGVMKLVEKGLIDLDAPLSVYLKSWKFPENDYPVEKVTIRRLLNHSAGLPLGDFTDTYAPGEEMPSLREKLTQEAILLREPGAGFSYSNVGYNLLELLIEEVTGQSFAEYMRSEVLLPLGMERAAFAVDETMAQYPPTGYTLDGKPVPVYLYPTKASGGLFATVEDIARFAAADMQENPVLRAESVRLMYAPESEVRKIGIYGLVFDAYGLGHCTETLPNGALSVAHGGQGNGIMTHFQAVPKTGDAFVILTNSQRSWPFISYLLSDWAQWRSFPSVGMRRIIWGQYVLSAVIGMLVSASLLIVLSLGLSFARQKRTGIRIFRIGCALLLLGTLIWAACQKYLFISSVFPVLSGWLGGAVFVFAIFLFISALIPCRSHIQNVRS